MTRAARFGRPYLLCIATQGRAQDARCGPRAGKTSQHGTSPRSFICAHRVPYRGESASANAWEVKRPHLCTYWVQEPSMYVFWQDVGSKCCLAQPCVTGARITEAGESERPRCCCGSSDSHVTYSLTSQRIIQDRRSLCPACRTQLRCQQHRHRR